MRKNITKILFGAAAIACGIILLGAAFGAWRLDAIRGWWTLFIIIPAVGGMISDGINAWNTMLLCFGALLFVKAQRLLTVEQFWLIFASATLVTIGVSFIFGGRSRRLKNPPEQSDSAETQQSFETDGARQPPPTFTPDSSRQCPRYTAIFTAGEYKYGGAPFTSGSAVAIFGGLDIDLSATVFERDAVFDATAIFGGIDIFVPPGLSVTAHGVSAFGGCDNFAASEPVPGAPVLHIKYNAVFGGVDIKVR